MKLEGVTTCVGYDDFLEHSLAVNMEDLDRVIVVTTEADKKTQLLCRKMSVDCVITDQFHKGGAKFNKGRAINVGLAHLAHDAWIIHFDADTVFPHRMRKMLLHAELDESCIYGADRLNSVSYENWIKNKHKLIPSHQYRYMVTPPPEFPMGSRLLHKEYGYCPIGYFQLWHSKKGFQYPVTCGSAEHSDVLFAMQWPLDKRRLLPEMFVYHLESDGSAPMGVNWNGRKTKPFKPSEHHHQKPEQHHEKHNHHGHSHEVHHHHHHHGYNGPYKPTHIPPSLDPNWNPPQPPPWVFPEGSSPDQWEMRKLKK